MYGYVLTYVIYMCVVSSWFLHPNDVPELIPLFKNQWVFNLYIIKGEIVQNCVVFPSKLQGELLFFSSSFFGGFTINQMWFIVLLEFSLVRITYTDARTLLSYVYSSVGYKYNASVILCCAFICRWWRSDNGRWGCRVFGYVKVSKVWT